MNNEQIIGKFFQNKQDAIAYVRSRLLGNFHEAPPPPSDRFIEEFPTDVLQHLVLSDDLVDKAIFWDACFDLFQEWSDPRKADGNNASGLSELIYMIRQFSHYHEDIFKEEKKRWEEELKKTEPLQIHTCSEPEKNMVYTQNLSLVHIWDLWKQAEWSELYEHILATKSVNHDTQFELMLITAQKLDWNETKIRGFFEWTLAHQDHVPATFYNEYFFNRLYLCGSRKDCQEKLVDDTLKACGWLSEILTCEQKKTLGKALLEASQLFDLKSFKCLGKIKRSLLKDELGKLANPPSEEEVNIYKPITETPDRNNYMSNQYAGMPNTTLLPA